MFFMIHKVSTTTITWSRSYIFSYPAFQRLAIYRFYPKSKTYLTMAEKDFLKSEIPKSTRVLRQRRPVSYTSPKRVRVPKVSGGKKATSKSSAKSVTHGTKTLTKKNPPKTLSAKKSPLKISLAKKLIEIKSAVKKLPKVLPGPGISPTL